jgi:hypothetical protein
MTPTAIRSKPAPPTGIQGARRVGFLLPTFQDAHRILTGGDDGEAGSVERSERADIIDQVVTRAATYVEMID